MAEHAISTRGLACSVSASLLFGFIPWYVQWLAPLSGSTVFWVRIVFSGVIALITLCWLKQYNDFKILLCNRKQTLLLSLGAILVGIQWWLFLWAPVNGLTKELSLGYFLLPLTLALTGRLIYGEQLRPLQKLAFVAAITGVANELYAVGSLSWVPLVVAGLYPVYFVIRRRVNVNALVCFTFENTLLLPFAIAGLILDQNFSDALFCNWHLVLLLPGLGIITTSSVLVYIAAARLLPVSLFGLLGYLESAVIFAIAILILGEPIPAEQWLTYGFILVAAILVCFDSVTLIRKPAIG